ncbi:hypothetical protein VYU27_009999, partial [Nannochloropsis oceanica]
PGEAFYGLFLKECLEKHKAMVAELKRRKDAREKREAERIAIEREERDRREKLRAEREAAATAAAAEGQKKAKEDDNTAAEGVAAAAAAAAAKVGEGGESRPEEEKKEDKMEKKEEEESGKEGGKEAIVSIKRDEWPPPAESEYRSRGGGGEGGGEGGERGQEAAAAGAEGAKEAVKEDRVSIFQARDVAAILQALVVLYQLDATRYTPPPAFLDAFGQHTVDADDTDNSLDRFHGTDMAIAVNCLATLGHPPPDSTLAALADTCLRRRFEGFEGQGLANLIQVMASLGHDPGRRFLESFVDACLHRRTLDTLEIQDATSLLHGLALVKHHPGDRFLSRFLPSVLLPFRHAVEECAPVSVHGMLPPTSTRKFTPQDFGRLMLALGTFKYKPVSSLYERRREGREGGRDGGRVGAAPTQHKEGAAPAALPRVPAPVPLDFWTGLVLPYCTKACRLQEALGPQDLASLVFAFGALGFNPGDAFLHLLVEACLGKSLQSFESQALALLVTSLGELEHSPGETFLRLLESVCVEGKFDGFTQKSLPLLLAGLATLRYRPSAPPTSSPASMGAAALSTDSSAFFNLAAERARELGLRSFSTE